MTRFWLNLKLFFRQYVFRNGEEKFINPQIQGNNISFSFPTGVIEIFYYK